MSLIRKTAKQTRKIKQIRFVENHPLSWNKQRRQLPVSVALSSFYGVFRRGNHLPVLLGGKKKRVGLQQKAASFMQAAKYKKRFENLSQIKKASSYPFTGGSACDAII